MKTVIDDYVRKESLIYGLYYKESINYIKENNYTTKLTKKFLDTFKFTDQNTNNEIQLVDRHIKDYIDNI